MLKHSHCNIFFLYFCLQISFIPLCKFLFTFSEKSKRKEIKKKVTKPFICLLIYFSYFFLQVADDSFSSHIFELSLDSEDSRLGFQNSYANNHKQMHNGINTSNSSSPMSSRRDFSSSPSTPSSSSSLPLEAAFSQFAASFSTIMNDKESAASALDKKISELERLRNKINSNSDSHSSASSTTSSSCSTSTSAAQSKVNTSRYKTELCRPFSEHGTCKYGEKCQFAHGQAELRSVTRHPKYKTDLCKTYHSVGFCPYGPRCHFVHNLDEVTNDAKNSQGQQQPPAPKQHQNPAFTPISSNKIIGSGRIISAINKLPSEDQPQQQKQQQIKPLPMFDTVRNNNNQQQQQKSSQRGNNFYPNPSGWNPLNCNSFGLNVDQKQAPRLPVFSTLSK